jgi:hypothetical protein
VHVHYLQPEAGDPLHQPQESSLIGQFGPKGCRARAYDDLAIVEFRAQCGARLSRESDLVRLWSHQSQIQSLFGYGNESAWSNCADSVPGG